MLSKKVIETAAHFLSGDNIEEQVIAIMNYNGDVKLDFIDNIEEVEPTQAAEYSYTVGAFLDMLPFNQDNKTDSDTINAKLDDLLKIRRKIENIKDETDVDTSDLFDVLEEIDQVVYNILLTHVIK